MRRSIPGKKQGETLPMAYGISRRTGAVSGGHFWNPPEDCEKRVLHDGKDRWVDAYSCLHCKRRNAGCPAKECNHKLTHEEILQQVYRPRRRS